MSINFRKQSQEQSTSNRHWPQIVYIFPAFNVLYRVVAKIKLFSLKFCAPRSKKEKIRRVKLPSRLKRSMQIPSSCFDYGAPKKLGLFLQRLVSGKEFWHLQNLKMCALKIIFDIWKTLLENAYHQVKVSQNLALNIPWWNWAS